MYSFYPAKKAPMQFGRLAMGCSQTLYRRSKDVDSTMFSLPTIVFGIFGRIYPAVFDFQDLVLHKTMHSTSSFYMVSFSNSSQFVKDYNFIEVDPSLFNDYIIDVNKSYRENCYNLGGRYFVEYEFVSPICMFANIKNINVESEKIVNPFYIELNDKDAIGRKKFLNLYEKMIILLRNLYHGNKEDQEDLGNLILDFINKNLKFYAEYSHDNPFAMTLSELKLKYPAFMQHFLSVNNALTVNLGQQFSAKTLSDVIRDNCLQIFKQHVYLDDVATVKKDHEHESHFKTVEEDEYARPVFD